METSEKEDGEYLLLKKTKEKDGEEYLVVKRTKVKDGTEHRMTKSKKIVGLERTERVLPTGTTFTVVGEG
ncbi:hypothetical protein E2562_023303 [Oryza meyeriana var. granulata]|uniref:Uncharacterized protein n=1 Tax=Oryza meyeriana var. granulata TaxID=110450 RepID=A0A6G1DM74_9ORYZ|nr:hypothetical protein E2562_023303 [Oryza meyeriana var. granulata]